MRVCYFMQMDTRYFRAPDALDPRLVLVASVPLRADDEDALRRGAAVAVLLLQSRW